MLNEPVKVVVEDDHHMLMDNQLMDKEKYMKIHSSDDGREQYGSKDDGSVMRVRDNQLVRDVFVRKEVDIMDERVRISGVDMSDVSMIRVGRFDVMGR